MPIVPDDSTDWTKLASEVREMAQRQTEPATKEWLFSLVAEYERLAVLTGQRKD